MTTYAIEEVDRDWVIDVFEKYNPHVERDEGGLADFRFKRPIWGIAATIYSPAYIPISEERRIEFSEPTFRGTGDGSPFSLKNWERPETIRPRYRSYSIDTYDRVFSPSSHGISELRRSFPEFFEQEKKLVLLEGDESNPDKVEDRIKEIRSAGNDPKEYVFLPVLQGPGSSKLGEQFLEYLTAFHFINRGYIVTFYGARNQKGAADLFAYRVPELADRYGGAFAFELLLDSEGGQITGGEGQRSITVEVEPTDTRTLSKGSSGIGQIKKQQYYRGFSGAYSAGPATRTYSEERIGTIVYNDRAIKRVEDPEEFRDSNEETLNGFKEFAKFLLIEGEYDEIAANSDSFESFVQSLCDMSLEQVCESWK